MSDAAPGVHADVPGRDVRRGGAPDARLRTEVLSAARTLERLLEQGDVLGPEVSEVITTTVAEVHRRLERAELAVVVVGEKKAGKSTFLNAILGARVLPTEVRECTGAVTFIRSASVPTYRALLQNGETAEFQHVEAAERATVARAIESLKRRLGGDADLEVPPTPDEAARAKREAEAARDDCTTRIATADDEAKKAADACEVGLASGAELEEQLAIARARAQAEERAFAESRAPLLREAERQGLALPGLQSDDVAALATTLAAAETRLATATAAAPFFLRPAPVWAFWIVLLRVLLQGFVRAKARALAEAREHHRFTRLTLVACEASARLAEAKLNEQELTARLESARRALADAHERARIAGGDRKAAEEQLAAARSELLECERAEQRAELGTLRARAAAIEEEFHRRFRAEVHELIDMEKRGRDVVELSIGYPAKHLPKGITIIDTPGVNTDSAENRARAWDVIRREADGCLLVSDLQAVVSRSTRRFLQEVREIIPHILLVMTKVDGALANAHVVKLEPWQRVEEARRNGVKKFAKEVGREPEDVFSIAVAAEPALRRDFAGDVLARRFPGEVAKLFNLLESEKDLVLGARAAAALRFCVQQISEAESRTEEKYRQRIAELEEQRLPDPADFQARQLARIEGALRMHSGDIAKRARAAMSSGVDQLEQRWLEGIRVCEDKDDVKATVAMIGEEGQPQIAAVVRTVEGVIREGSASAIKALETVLLEELRERYRIVQQMTGSTAKVQLGDVRTGGAPSHVSGLHANVAGAVSSFENEQLAFGAGGALAGAAIGTIILPGIGTAIGAALGALATYLKTLDSLKNDCVREVQKGLEDARQNLVQQLANVEVDAQRAMRAALARGLEDAVTRFDSWIKQVMEDERLHIERECEKLAKLIKTREALIKHDRTLAAVQRATATLSRGLCA